MHQISALIGRLPVDKASARYYDLPVFEEEGLAIVGLDRFHSDVWKDQLGLPGGERSLIPLDCPTTHYFARDIFGEEMYALIWTDYFGGAGEQSAAVYRCGTALMPATTGFCGPINQALAMLGVKRTGKRDEFDSIHLSWYRGFGEYFRKYHEHLIRSG